MERAVKDAGGNLPLYLSHTPRERDEFVRALGLADGDEISLFNLLCSYAAKRATVKVGVSELLAAVTSWARSHAKPNLMGGAARGSLKRLLAVLERNGYATMKEDQQTILLRDGERRAGRGEKAVAEIARVYQVMENDPLQGYPSSAEIQVPQTALDTASYTEFTSALLATQADSSRILRVTFAEGMDILVTAEYLPRLMDVARRRVHFYIQNNPNLYNYVIFELRKIPQFRHIVDQQRLYSYLENRVETPPLFWVYLALAVARSRNEELLEPKLRPGRTSLFLSAYLLHGWWQHQHKIDQERKQREADRTVLMGWAERSGRAFSMEELEDVRDEAGRPFRDKYEDPRGFVEEILEGQRAEADAAGKVPPILHFGELWMHRSALLPLLQQDIRAASELCRRTVEPEWKSKLEKGTVTDPAMNDDEAFASELHALVESRCPNLAIVLKKPRLVHLAITEAAESDPSLFRTHGQLFEGLDDPTWKRMDRLLGLDREQIVLHIVSGMSLLRRFLLRRRFRLKKPEARSAQSPLKPTEQARGEAGARQGTQTVKVTRPKKGKPDTMVVERPSRKKKEPKTVDEAVVKLRQAMDKRRKP